MSASHPAWQRLAHFHANAPPLAKKIGWQER
jgi:hypothetical protein